MIINGRDVGALEQQSIHYPSVVPGRVAQIDADFIAYISTYEAVGNHKSWSNMVDQAWDMIEHLRKHSRSEKALLHVTPSNSNKGGRAAQAIQKPYQERDNGEKPEFLEQMRMHMHQEWGAILCVDYEADDSMCMSQCKDLDKSIIISKDKDLRMVPGLHMDWDTNEIYNPYDIENGWDTFGYVEMKQLSSSKKAVGYGTSFFWAQMLMGDPVDTVQGLPKVTGDCANQIWPKKETIAAFNVLNNENSTEEQRASAQARLDKRAAVNIGPAKAVEIIQKCRDDRHAYKVVSTLYKRYGEVFGFNHWETHEPVDWRKVLISEGYLLWMRRTPDPKDFTKWLTGVLS